MKKYSLDISTIADKAMLPVIMKRVILKARMLTKQEKQSNERGGADIIVTSPLGGSGKIKRDELIQNYLYTNGRKIKISAWKAGREYMVVAGDDTPAFAMMVPENCNIVINSNKVETENSRGRGQYIICFADENGDPDISTVGVISDILFHKMCYMPQHSIIVQYRGSGNRQLNSKLAMRLGIEDQNNIAQETETIRKPRRQTNRPESRPVEKPVIQQKAVNTPKMVMAGQTGNSGASIEVVGQVHNEYGQRIGFIIASGNSSNTKQVSSDTLIGLCRAKKIVNVSAVVKENGDYFLRGNSISLDSLPITYK